MKHLLTIDFEDFWNNLLIKRMLSTWKEDYLDEVTNEILELLRTNYCTATFFVLGATAERRPDLIQQISEAGHEIAVHSYSHRSLLEMSNDEIRKDLRRCFDILSKYDPIGFRAPMFTLTNENAGLIRILRDAGFQYDSSVYPYTTHLDNLPMFRRDFYYPSLDDFRIEDESSGIIEVPLSVFEAGPLRYPISGGFFSRIMPECFLSGMKVLSKKSIMVHYIHPWELTSGIPDFEDTALASLVGKYNVRNCKRRFRKNVESLNFRSIYSYLEDMHLLRK